MPLKKYPTLKKASEIFQKNHRFSGAIVGRCFALFGDDWATEFERVLSGLFADDDALAKAINGYSIFAMHSMRLQAQFEREGIYKSKSYAEAAQEVYLNEQHMMSEYLPGLLLSHFLWPHHYRQIQFFNTAFLGAMKNAGATSFIEVGVGTGIYSNLALQKLPEISGVGVDISPSSKKFTDLQMQALGTSSRYHVELRDITGEPLPNKTDWLVCVEVLEHLEDPVGFLRGLKANMNPGARAFITAAINAAHADHIYLYRNANEVLAHLNEAGFILEQYFVGTAYKPSSPKLPIPEAVAFIVQN